MSKTFSKSSHVAYQIKGNETYDNMLANSLPVHTPFTPGWGLRSADSHVAYKMNRKVGHAHTIVVYTMGGLRWGVGLPLIP